MTANGSQPPSVVKGTKSYLAMIVSGLATPWLVSRLGFDVTQDLQLQITAAIVAGVGVVTRSISSGPPLEGLRNLISRKRQPQVQPLALHPATVSVLVQTMAPMIVKLVEKILDQKTKAKSEEKEVVKV